MGLSTSSGVTYEALSLRNNLYINSTAYIILIKFKVYNYNVNKATTKQNKTKTNKKLRIKRERQSHITC